MYSEQTVELISANFCKRMYVNKRSSANFQQNCPRRSSSFSKSNIQIKNTGKYVIISQTVIDIGNIAVSKTYEVACGLSIGICNITLANSKGQDQDRGHFDCVYLINCKK